MIIKRSIYRAISLIVLVCFLFNTTVADLALGQTISNYASNSDKLAASSRFDDIQHGPEGQDMSRIRFILEGHLIGAKRLDSDGDGEIDMVDLIRAVREYRDSDRQPVTVFANEAQPITDNWFWVRCDINHRVYGLKTYFAVFPKRSSGEGFPVEVYTAAEWKRNKDLITRLSLPRRRESILKRDRLMAAAIERGVRHQGIETRDHAMGASANIPADEIAHLAGVSFIKRVTEYEPKDEQVRNFFPSAEGGSDTAAIHRFFVSVGRLSPRELKSLEEELLRDQAEGRSYFNAVGNTTIGFIEKVNVLSGWFARLEAIADGALGKISQPVFRDEKASGLSAYIKEEPLIVNAVAVLMGRHIGRDVSSRITTLNNLLSEGKLSAEGEIIASIAVADNDRLSELFEILSKDPGPVKILDKIFILAGLIVNNAEGKDKYCIELDEILTRENLVSIEDQETKNMARILMHSVLLSGDPSHAEQLRRILGEGFTGERPIKLPGEDGLAGIVTAVNEVLARLALILANDITQHDIDRLDEIESEGALGDLEEALIVSGRIVCAHNKLEARFVADEVRRKAADKSFPIPDIDLLATEPERVEPPTHEPKSPPQEREGTAVTPRAVKPRAVKEKEGALIAGRNFVRERAGLDPDGRDILEAFGSNTRERDDFFVRIGTLQEKSWPDFNILEMRLKNLARMKSRIDRLQGRSAGGESINIDDIRALLGELEEEIAQRDLMRDRFKMLKAIADEALSPESLKGAKPIPFICNTTLPPRTAAILINVATVLAGRFFIKMDTERDEEWDAEIDGYGAIAIEIAAMSMGLTDMLETKGSQPLSFLEQTLILIASGENERLSGRLRESNLTPLEKILILTGLIINNPAERNRYEPDLLKILNGHDPAAQLKGKEKEVGELLMSMVLARSQHENLNRMLDSFSALTPITEILIRLAFIANNFGVPNTHAERLTEISPKSSLSQLEKALSFTGLIIHDYYRIEAKRKREREARISPERPPDRSGAGMITRPGVPKIIEELQPTHPGTIELRPPWEDMGDRSPKPAAVEKEAKESFQIPDFPDDILEGGSPGTSARQGMSEADLGGERVSSPEDADRAIVSMKLYNDAFKGKDKEDLKFAFAYITSALSVIEETVRKKRGEEGIRTVKIGVIPGGGPKDTLVVRVRDADTPTERDIGIYESYLRGLTDLLKMIENRESGAKWEIFEALVRGSLLHEVGHSFEGYSGILDIHSIFRSKESRDEIAELFGLQAMREEEGWTDENDFFAVVAETLADSCLAGPGGKDYVKNKAAYLFYKFIVPNPGKYEYQGYADKIRIRELVDNHYMENKHLSIWAGNDIKAVADMVISYYSTFFGRQAQGVIATRTSRVTPSAPNTTAASQSIDPDTTRAIKSALKRATSSNQKTREAARRELTGLGEPAVAAIKAEIKNTGARGERGRLLNAALRETNRSRGTSAQQGMSERPPEGAGVIGIEDTWGDIVKLARAHNEKIDEIRKGLQQLSPSELLILFRAYMEDYMRLKFPIIALQDNPADREVVLKKFCTILKTIGIKVALSDKGCPALYMPIKDIITEVYESKREDVKSYAAMAQEAGKEIMRRGIRYKLIVDSGLYKDGEYKGDKEGVDLDEQHYAGVDDRFELVHTDTSRVESIMAQIGGADSAERTIVQVSKELTAGELAELEKAAPGIRVIRIDTQNSDIKYAPQETDLERRQYRFDLYAMLVAARALTKEDLAKGMESKIYAILRMFLKAHCALEGDVDLDQFAKDYMKALTDNENRFIVKHCLSYKLTGRWDSPDYHLVTMALIYA